METIVSRLNLAWVDSGFDSDPFMQWVMDFYRWIVQVVIRPKEHKGFVLLPKRWVVERTFGWLVCCLRLNKDYELLAVTAETFISLAIALLNEIQKKRHHWQKLSALVVKYSKLNLLCGCL